MRIHSRRRRTYLIVGAGLVLAAVGGGLSVALGSTSAQTGSATAVATTITIDPASNETFAPPPSDAAPTITASQAWTQYAQNIGATTVTIPANFTVQLGLLTFPVGPYCGAECDGYTVQNGIAYHALNELTYGYSYSACPPGSTLPAIQCTRWVFLDAKTAKVIDIVLNQQGASGSS